MYVCMYACMYVCMYVHIHLSPCETITGKPSAELSRSSGHLDFESMQSHWVAVEATSTTKGPCD